MHLFLKDNPILFFPSRINEFLSRTEERLKTFYTLENVMSAAGDSVVEWLGTPACHRSSGIAMAPGSDEGDVHILDMTSL